MTRRASDVLIAHIKTCEGYRSKAYRCPAGVWTCGYGHTKGVTAHTTCDKAKADAWLREELSPVEAFCNAIKNVDTQGKFDAVVDFAFNVGLGNLRQSTLLKRIQAGATDKEVCAELRKWVYANGRKLQGLVARREWECERWKEGRV